MVLLKENQTPIYIDVVRSNQSPIARATPIREVIRTCRNQVIIDLFPISLISDGFNSIPTINKRNAIPIFAKAWKLSFPCKTLGNNIVNAVPAIIYQIIIGCFKAFIIPNVTRTTASIIANAQKICSDTFFYLVNKIHN